MAPSNTEDELSAPVEARGQRKLLLENMARFYRLETQGLRLVGRLDQIPSLR